MHAVQIHPADAGDIEAAGNRVAAPVKIPAIGPIYRPRPNGSNLVASVKSIEYLGMTPTLKVR